MKINVSGRLYDIAAYGVRQEDCLIHMEDVAKIAEERKPKLIVAGWSAYPRQLDFAALPRDRRQRRRDADGRHGPLRRPRGRGRAPHRRCPYADVVTTTIHKTIGGGRSGMILAKEEYEKKINSAVFPGQQGGPLMHIIAGKAVAFKIAMSEQFKERQQRTRRGASILAEQMLAQGVNVLTGGTDVHLVLADLQGSGLNGQEAEDRLHEIDITVNRNSIPFDPLPPAVSSGLRIGTPALATRGFQDDDFTEVGDVIATALATEDWNDATRDELRGRVKTLADKYPLYEYLNETVADQAESSASALDDADDLREGGRVAARVGRRQREAIAAGRELAVAYCRSCNGRRRRPSWRRRRRRG